MKKLLLLLAAAGAALAFWRRKTLKDDAKAVQAKATEAAGKAQDRFSPGSPLETDDPEGSPDEEEAGPIQGEETDTAAS